MNSRQQKTYQVNNIPAFAEKVVGWAQDFSHFSYFNPDNTAYRLGSFAHFVAIGCHKKLTFDGVDDFALLKDQAEAEQQWLVGYLGYDLKNQLEKLQSNHKDYNKFHAVYFYIPEYLVHFQDNHVIITSFDDPDKVFDQVSNCEKVSKQCPPKEGKVSRQSPAKDVKITASVSRQEYVDTVKHIREHIINGDVYELNYCMVFYGEAFACDPLELYQRLTQHSPAPFSVFQRIEDEYLMCASPERFIKKTNDKLICQPIKGTIRRGNTSSEDVILQRRLKHSEKERAENMMIVDLVRNDLARSCVAGSIKVEEMFGVYPFRHLHQMISTVCGTLRDDVHFVDAIKDAFPMGSMTGAPKVMAMKLIEQYESAQRGLFSGAVGYITPWADFDFNVVIRSMFYHAQNKTISFQAGSAITYDSDPQREYEECLLKARAIQEVLNVKGQLTS